MDMFLKSSQPENFRITFAGPPGTGKGAAIDAIQRQLPEEYLEDLDPFEIEGTEMISLVISLAAIVDGEPEEDKLRITTSTGPIQNLAPMNRLCDRADGILFFMPDTGTETEDAWGQVEATFAKRNRAMDDAEIVFLLTSEEAASNPSVKSWVQEYGGDAMMATGSPDQWATNALKKVAGKVVSKVYVNESGESVELFVPPDEAIIRSHHQSLFSKLFGRRKKPV